jgi:hypothetical protein
VTGRGPFGDTATHADHVVGILLIEETANLRRTAAGAAVDNLIFGINESLRNEHYTDGAILF